MDVLMQHYGALACIQ